MDCPPRLRLTQGAGRVGLWLLLFVAWIPAWQIAMARPVSVSEIHYNPVEGSDYEFIELINPGQTAVNLAGARFTNGIDYTFETTTLLGAGARLVVCADRSKFTSLHGGGVPLAPGSFKGKLDDQGEQITLVSAAGEILFQFKYDSSGAWPSRPNGLGSSLECLDPDGKLGDPDNWRASAEWGGSPGRAGAGPQSLVVINEVLAHTDPPLEDAIELLNLTGQPVDISGWYLSNSRENPRKYRIPAKTVLAPHGFRVFFEYQFGPNGDTGDSFRLNSAHGDFVVLLSADGLGNPLLWMDTVHFEATENGVSLGRVPDGTGPLVALADLSLGTGVRAGFPESFLSEFRKAPGASNSAPRVGPLGFQTIQHSPPDGDFEYVAIRNFSAAEVPLYDPAHPTNTWRLLDGVLFDFPARVSLAAGASLVVCATNESSFRKVHPEMAGIQVFGPWTNRLSNTGERLALYKPDLPQLPPHPDAGFVPYILVEEVMYRDSSPWPVVEVGELTGIERVTAGYGNDGANWRGRVMLKPVVAPVAIIDKVAQGLIRIRCNDQPGHTFSLEASNGLPGGWQPLTGVQPQSTGGEVTFEVNPAGAPRFFRILVQ